jgi:hypothetical protein
MARTVVGGLGAEGFQLRSFRTELYDTQKGVFPPGRGASPRRVHLVLKSTHSGMDPSSTFQPPWTLVHRLLVVWLSTKAVFVTLIVSLHPFWRL